MLLFIRDFFDEHLFRLPGHHAMGFITFRTGVALIVAFIIALAMGPWLIAYLRSLKAGQQIRDDQGAGAISLKDMHKAKVGTPTAGGLMIVAALLASTLILGDLSNLYVWLMIIVIVGFAFIGFLDDYLKITKKNSKGLPGRYKLIGQMVLATMVAGFMMIEPYPINYSLAPGAGNGGTSLALPFLKDFWVNLGWFYLPFVFLVIAGASNGVNLTDGLDGLAIGVSIIATGAFTILTYLVSRADFAGFLLLPHVAGSGELCVVLGALIGGSMGFLWYNAHPAQVFMGDTGSLMIGGVLGTVAVITKSEALLVIIGGVFVIETLSVMIQVTSYRLWKKRVFRMAPIHHHFEKCGWYEPQIITRFYIIASLLALFGLSTLRLR